MTGTAGVKFTCMSAILAFASMIFCGCAAGKGVYPDAGISIDDMKASVAYLSSIDPPRNHENVESLDRSAKYIHDRLEQYGLKPKEQPFLVGGRRYLNIVANVGPATGSRIVVGAHYDVCGDQPGADDNASGVAGLLEIARFAKKHEAGLRHNIEFLAYALEEPPYYGTKYMGSYIHAASLHENGGPVTGMISLEMIGYFNDGEGSQEYPLGIMKLFYPKRGDFIAVVGDFSSFFFTRKVARHMKAAAIDVETLHAPRFIKGVDLSDHMNYRKFGYDAVMVTDTAFYRNGNYHTGGDTIDTLSFERMREVVKGVCWAILNIG